MTDETPAAAFNRYLRETEHLVGRPANRNPIPLWEQALALLVGVALFGFVVSVAWRVGQGLLQAFLRHQHLT
ncbi:hypothetical protein [Methylobacterium thuringiense]|uniref:Uncharacterized protein n=1 Tax=Methylobacterium thuringiense TaxID=1003091 RepID=A0ABQ4TRU0_9HYPH|nr:hypothetical protein [Methylobacterium thuringiense]GJE57378.1 hypothetical protein EKPJFOCH_3892 [Methylobacterium thuringiense]